MKLITLVRYTTSVIVGMNLFTSSTLAQEVDDNRCSNPIESQVEIRLDLVSKTTASDTDESLKDGRDRFVVLSICNGMSQPIDVPESYSSRDVRLCASGSRGTAWPLALHRRRPLDSPPPEAEAKPKTVSVSPGKKHEVLRIDVRDVMLNPGDIYSHDPKREFAQSRWVWNWTAHPGPDYSPFEKRKGDKRSNIAVLWGELDVNKQTLRSIPILIDKDH